MISNMISLLGKEQQDDDDKKEYCENLLDKTEDDVKALELSVSDLGKAVADYKEQIATLAEEIEALEDGIKSLDKQVAEATEDRKEEHEENVETLASDNAAKDLIGIAKNRMNKFYNPKLYKPPPKVETAMFVQRSGVAPPPPPETFGAYAEKGANDAKSIEDKESAKADLEGTLVASKEEKAAKTKEAMATAQYLSEVHGDCDWLLSNFQVRKEARAGEVDALKKAKAVLSGADYSLLQVQHHDF